MINKYRRLRQRVKAVWKRLCEKYRETIKRQQENKRHQHRKRITQQKRFAKAAANNPYLQSKALWNDLYGSLQIKLENSYRIIFILSVVVVIAMIGFVVVAGETKVKSVPFIVHGDEIITASNAQTSRVNALKPRLALYFAKAFIRSARTVSVDGDVNTNHIITAFSFVTGSATQVLKDFYQQHSPNTIAQRYVKNITITSLLRNSPRTLTIRWREDWRSSHTGELLRSRYYIAQLTYRYQHPSQNKTILRHNPLGFYVTHLSWSNDQKT